MDEISERGFLLCPRCGKPTHTKVTPGRTTLEDFPLWCSRCKIETEIQYPNARADSQSERS